jgi:hypothetical protein
MFRTDDLLHDSALKRLNKSGRELVLAFVDALEKQGSKPTGGALDGWERLTKADPDPTTTHVSTELTDVSLMYLQDASMFAASGQGFIPANVPAGFINRYNKGDIFRVKPEMAVRGPAAESAGGGFKIDNLPFACIPYAIHKDVDEQLQATQIVGDPVDDANSYVTQQLLLIREAVWVAKLFAAGLWSIDLTGVPGAPAGGQFKQWDQASSTPREDLSLNAINIFQKTGKWPNRLTVTPFVLRGLLLNAEIVAAFQYTTAGATPDLVALAKCLFMPAMAAAQAAGVAAAEPRLAICGGIQTTSDEGQADVLSFIGGKGALLAYVADRPGLREVSAYYTVGWTGLLGSNALGFRIKDFPLERNGVTHRIEGETAFDIPLTGTDLAAFFATAVS